MEGQDLSDLLSRQNAIPVAMVPVTCDTFDLRAQSVIADKANKPWSPGSFVQTFPDLAALSDGLGALQPEQIAKVLRNLRERTGKEVEVSGLKLPLEVITRWGLIVIPAGPVAIGASDPPGQGARPGPNCLCEKNNSHDTNPRGNSKITPPLALAPPTPFSHP